MLKLNSGFTRDCDGVSRRNFLQVGGLAGVGLSLPTFLGLRAAQAKAAKPAKDVNVIVVWSQGGVSHHDTFDPKPEAAVSVRGEFKAIDTALPGVQFAEILPRMAKEAKRFGLLRGWNPRNGAHGLADQYVLSGKKVNPAIHYPTFGSVVSSVKGFKSAMPPFVQLGTSIDRRFGGGMPGFLGLEHGPFEMPADPNAKQFTVRDITPPAGVDMQRISTRRSMLNTIDALQRKVELQPAAYDALDEHYKAALNMITAPETQRAFQIEKESDKTRDGYGRTPFGQRMLLARRLIESGVRFVSVTDGGWDTHQNNFTSLKTRLIPPVDQALPELLIDLEQRGLLDSTLVLWLSDFGRTPKINSASGRDHWATAGFAIAAGAGIPGGSVVGRTDDEGGYVVNDEYFSEDIAATLFAKIGIDPHTMLTTTDGRPVVLNEGRVIREWM
ncbi:MAG: DUF1501 domain-containing protein [Planctomycetaceae bacterium]|nr:DUF1501 domain-containing protein [Planctomycetaceae bacterium]